MSIPTLGSTMPETNRLGSESVVDWEDMLHFPIDTQGALTPFRERALSYIYRTARGLSGGLLESAAVEATSDLDEENSLHLHLAMTINANWEELDRLHDQILEKLAEWSRELSVNDQEDYGRWIFFSLTPSRI